MKSRSAMGKVLQHAIRYSQQFVKSQNRYYFDMVKLAITCRGFDAIRSGVCDVM